jgi:hypothetical protein
MILFMMAAYEPSYLEQEVEESDVSQRVPAPIPAVKLSPTAAKFLTHEKSSKDWPWHNSNSDDRQVRSASCMFILMIWVVLNEGQGETSAQDGKPRKNGRGEEL